MQDYRLTVVFCAVDESEILKKTFLKIYSCGEQFEYLFILSKNCTKECLQTVEKICAQYSCCRFMYQSGTGLGNAIQDAFESARGTHLLVWSADDAIDVNVFPRLLALSKQNSEAIVKISRWLPGGGFHNYGTVRKIINFISQKLFAILYQSKLTDFTNPTQIAPMSIYRCIKWERKDAAFPPEMVVKPLRLNYEFIEVPCQTYATSKKNSHISFISQFKYYYIIFKVRFSKCESLMKGKA